ncbi:YjbF family lipoprotein [Puniceibacterium confluentis]|uniref:YjbF family lipoprotein n=1 Tax=Puniceibacterium confluentis TaxID=1958944 RepID=UPI0016464DAD|nr:YjbF family lipoprotein [Puniceibacterium confluentis]
MHGFARILTVVSLSLGLAACGNDRNATSPVDMVQQVFRSLTSGGTAGSGAQIPASQIETAYAATPAPIALVTIESRQGQALVLEIERNGAYQTFATSGRQVVVLRNGMITGTRGLGGDLMSSDADGLVALIRARQAGKTPYAMRFLTGEDVTETLSYSCDVFPDGTQSLTQGRIRTTATKMIANCTGAGKPFTDTFLVDSTGYALSSRQWVGDYNNYLRVETLRK